MPFSMSNVIFLSDCFNLMYVHQGYFILLPSYTSYIFVLALNTLLSPSVEPFNCPPMDSTSGNHLKVLYLTLPHVFPLEFGGPQESHCSSALKSSLKTSKRLKLYQTKTAKDWTCSPGFSVLRLEDCKKTGCGGPVIHVAWGWMWKCKTCKTSIKCPRKNPKHLTLTLTHHTHYHNLSARVWGLWYWKISLVS